MSENFYSVLSLLIENKEVCDIELIGHLWTKEIIKTYKMREMIEVRLRQIPLSYILDLVVNSISLNRSMNSLEEQYWQDDILKLNDNKLLGQFCSFFSCVTKTELGFMDLIMHSYLEDGYCYLKLLNVIDPFYKLIITNTLGENPSLKFFLLSIMTFNLEHNLKSSGLNWNTYDIHSGKTDKIHLVEGNIGALNVLKHIDVYSNFKGCSIMNYSESQKEMTIYKGNVNNDRNFRIGSNTESPIVVTNMWKSPERMNTDSSISSATGQPRIANVPFTLRELALSQTEVKIMSSDYFQPNPHLYESTLCKLPEFSVIDIQSDEFTVSTSSGPKVFSILDQKSSSIRHDFVSSELTEETDMLLGVLIDSDDNSRFQPPYNKTPDYINVSRRLVVELTTVAVDYMDAIDSAYNKKTLTYSSELNMLGGISYFIMVVSPNYIKSNMKLNSKTVDLLCSRLRIALSVESELKMRLKKNIFTDRQTSNQEKSIKLLFEGLTLKDTDFNTTDYKKEDIIENSKLRLTPEEIDHCHNLLTKSFEKTSKATHKGSSYLNEHLDKFSDSNTRRNDKRICNFPFLRSRTLPNYSGDIRMEACDNYNEELPDYLRTLWESAFNHESGRIIEGESENEILRNALSEIDLEKHRKKKHSLFVVKQTGAEREELAMTGVQAKEVRYAKRVSENYKRTKLGFHPDTNTDDISAFIENDTLKKCYKKTFDESPILNLLKKTKIDIQGVRNNSSTTIFEKFVHNLEFTQFANQISMICQELAINYKHLTGPNQYMVKRLPFHNIIMILKSTGSHLFVSYAFSKKDCKNIDSGSLGVKCFDCGNYWISDFSSYNEVTLEHFVKSGPFMSAVLIHLLTHYKIDPFKTEVDELLTSKDYDNFWRTLKILLLTFLNNKTDVEEMLTAQRYLFMKLFEEKKSDPNQYVDRLPKVLRSRLTVWLQDRIVKIIRYYDGTKLKKRMNELGELDYLNIKSVFHDGNISLSQKINEFYFGYVVSKIKGRGSSRSYALLDKILGEEYYYRDNITNPLGTLEEPLKHMTDVHLLKYFLRIFSIKMTTLYGDNFKMLLSTDIITSINKITFTEISTLKVTSRDHSKVLKIREEDFVFQKNENNNIIKESWKIYLNIRKDNPEETSKRKKLIEAMPIIIKQYLRDTHRSNIDHVSELSFWALKHLREKGFFDSDIFPKSQHGGDREIHVLEILARLVQKLLETISTVICRKFKSETITHPETKENFVNSHYKTSNLSFDDFIVLSKSADATKWCQRHHVSRFAIMLCSLTEKIFHPFIIITLKLWTEKVIAFPPDLAAMLLANQNTLSSNDTFVRLRKEYYSGTGVFKTPGDNKITIKSGMMQGILHYTSSLFHVVIQETYKFLVDYLLGNVLNEKHHLTVVEGSDDSGAMLSVRNNKRMIDVAIKLLRWKEHLADYLSVNWNECKSSIGTIDLIEYNSEWYSRRKSIKPTMRWVTACLETSVVEKFVDRYRMFSDGLTTVLEGGGSIFECALIQLCQAWLHYKLLGFETHALSKLASDTIKDLPCPSAGYFPLDMDVCVGVTGFDFTLFCLANKTKYMNFIQSYTDTQDEGILDYLGRREKGFSKSLGNVKLRHGKLHLWYNLVESIGLGNLENAIEAAEDNPRLIFGKPKTWEEEKTAILLKVFSSGVKTSISNYQPTIRMMVSSAYMLDGKCMTIFQDNYTKLEEKENLQLNKISLMQLLLDLKKKENNLPRYEIDQLFPLYKEYFRLYKPLCSLNENKFFTYTELSRKNKVKLEVFKSFNNDEYTLMDMVKRQWFQMDTVKVSSSVFNMLWNECKVKYSFLEDNFEDTKRNTKLNSIELKEFLEGIHGKQRSIKLHDTNAKGSSIITAVTRIFWPNIKLRSKADEKLEFLDISLRSEIFSLLSYPLSTKKKYEYVSDLIRNSEVLSNDMGSLPEGLKRLKIIKNVLNKENYVKTLSDIYNLKLGTVGFFSVRQEVYGVGKGVWKGAASGMPCEIHFFDNRIVKIVCRSLIDPVALGQSLVRLLKETRLIMPDLVNIKTEFYLTNKGKIIKSKFWDVGTCPIIIDADLEFSYFEPNSYNEVLKVKIHKNTIRIVGFSEETEVTLLNDSFYQRDWDANTPINTNFPSFNEWHTGNPVKIKDFEILLKDVPSHNTGLHKWLELNRKSKIYDTEFFNLWELREVLNTLIFRDNKLRSVIQELKLKQSDIDVNDISKEMIDKHMEYGLERNLDELELVFSKFISEESDETPELIADLKFDEFDSNELEELITKLKYKFGNSEEIQEIIPLSQKEVSQSNLYFSTLDTLSYKTKSKSLQDLLSLSKQDWETERVPGVLGRFISVVISNSVLDRGEIDVDSEILDRIQDLELTVDSVTSLHDDLDLDTLEEGLKQLDLMIPNASGMFLDSLVELKHKYSRQKIILEASIVDLKNYSRELTMKSICKTLSKCTFELDEKYKIMDPDECITYLNYELKDYITNLLGNKIVTRAEANLYFHSLKRSELSVNLLEIVCSKYRLKAKLIDSQNNEIGEISSMGHTEEVVFLLL
jgi:hypothetical protein